MNLDLTTMSLLSRPTASAKTLNKIARGRHEPCLICPSNCRPRFSKMLEVSSSADFAGLSKFGRL